MKHATIPAVVLTLMHGRERIVNGWCQHKQHLGNAVCAGQAVWDEPEGYLAAHYLSRSLPLLSYSIPSFNDAPSTTKQDVLSLYDRAIALALDET